MYYHKNYTVQNYKALLCKLFGTIGSAENSDGILPEDIQDKVLKEIYEGEDVDLFLKMINRSLSDHHARRAAFPNTWAKYGHKYSRRS